MHLMDTLFLPEAAANEAIALSSEPVEFEHERGVSVGTAEIVLRWQPAPRVEVHATFPDAEAFVAAGPGRGAGECIWKFPHRALGTSVQVHSRTLSATSTLVATFLNWGVPDAQTRCARAVFHLPNMGRVLVQGLTPEGAVGYRESLELEGAGWRVVVTPTANCGAVERELREAGGFGITHRGVIERADGAAFTRESARELLDALGELFTFARGARTPPILARGFDQSGSMVWEELRTPRIDPWFIQHTWFDPHRGESLQALFPGFMAILADPVWQQPLRSALYWYAHANTQAGGADGSIVLAQSALELLSWVEIVQSRQSLSAHGFGRLTASDQIRLLLAACGIPAAIPPEASDLTQAARKQQPKWSDGPEALTAVRNAIVHPNLAKRMGLLDVLYDAWQLALWYIELVVLRRAGYSGAYGYRLKPRFAGDVQPVPWAA